MNWYPIIVTVLAVLGTLLAAVWSYKISKRKADDERNEFVAKETVDVEFEVDTKLRALGVNFYDGRTLDTITPFWVIDGKKLIFRQPLDTPIRLVIQGFDGDIIRTITRYFRAPDEVEPDRVGPHAD